MKKGLTSTSNYISYISHTSGAKYNLMCGFTLIEIVVSIAILLILLMVSIGAFRSLSDKQILSQDSDRVLSAIQRARSQTLASTNNQQYGVHFDQDMYTVFAGTTYMSGAPDNVESRINPRAEISTVFAGGESDLIFKKLTGDTDEHGTITISLKQNPSKFVNITVTETGITSISGGS